MSDIQWNFSGSNTDGSFTTAVSKSFLGPLEKNHTAADFGYFRVIFLFILKMVYFVFTKYTIFMVCAHNSVHTTYLHVIETQRDPYNAS